MSNISGWVVRSSIYSTYLSVSREQAPDTETCALRFLASTYLSRGWLQLVPKYFRYRDMSASFLASMHWLMSWCLDSNCNKCFSAPDTQTRVQPFVLAPMDLSWISWMMTRCLNMCHALRFYCLTTERSGLVVHTTDWRDTWMRWSHSRVNQRKCKQYNQTILLALYFLAKHSLMSCLHRRCASTDEIQSYTFAPAHPLSFSPRTHALNTFLALLLARPFFLLQTAHTGCLFNSAIMGNASPRSWRQLSATSK